MGRLLDEDDVINTLWGLRRNLQLMDNSQRADLILHGVFLAEKRIERLPSAQSEPQWIPVSERLPEEAYPVIVTWKNDDPASYYQFVLGKHYTGVAHYKNGKWFWYSSITEDVLMEYGRCDSEEFDEAIKVLAWMPLPEPYREEGD